MKRKIRLVFGQSVYDGAYKAWQEIKTIDLEVDLPWIKQGVKGVDSDDWHLLGGDWIKQIGGEE